MHIGDFARLANVSVRAVRFYDLTGLLPAMGVDPETGYRHYEIRQLARLRQVRALQGLGFSLKEIRELLCADVPDSLLRARMEERKAVIQRQVRDDVSRLERIETYLCHGAAARKTAIALHQTKEAWVVSLRAKLRRYDEADEMFLELERRVPAHLLTAPRSALWHSCESSGGAIDCEAVLYIKGSVSPARGLKVYQLPSTQVASVFHSAGDDSIGESYQALNRWLTSSDFRLYGAKREVYWPDSYSKNAALCITEIQFPVARLRTSRHKVA